MRVVFIATCYLEILQAISISKYAWLNLNPDSAIFSKQKEIKTEFGENV